MCVCMCLFVFSKRANNIADSMACINIHLPQSIALRNRGIEQIIAMIKIQNTIFFLLKVVSYKYITTNKYERGNK